jgi:quercetin dioxygenase-like cupin family protein
MPSLDEEFDRRIARLADRVEDWDTLGFQAAVDDKYRRAQIRYIGSGATGDHDNDPTIVPAENFTLSTMLLPPGAEGPLHLHSDAEEVFFVLDGEITFFVEKDGETSERVLSPRDAVSVPAGWYRGLRNDSDQEARMLVMVGAKKPKVPTYPENSEVRRPG